MGTPNRHILRVLSIATLATLGSALLCGLLFFAFPTFGRPHEIIFIYIPPQIILAALLTLLALFFAFVTSLCGFSQSWYARQHGWAAVFMVVILLLLFGPAYLCYSIGVAWLAWPPPPIPTPQELGWSTDMWWFLTASSAATLALSAICALAYASRVILRDKPRPGQR